MSVDGTDFRFPASDKFYWHSHKFKKPGVRYEVGLSIALGDIVWINGPFPAGHFPDLVIFRMGMKGLLDDGERVECDKGYRGEFPKKAKPPHPFYDYDPKIKKMKKRLAARHETVNSRIKQFKSMNGLFRHNYKMHSSCFRCIVVCVQLFIEHGDTLFDCKYTNY